MSIELIHALRAVQRIQERSDAHSPAVARALARVVLQGLERGNVKSIAPIARHAVLAPASTELVDRLQAQLSDDAARRVP